MHICGKFISVDVACERIEISRLVLALALFVRSNVHLVYAAT